MAKCSKKLWGMDTLILMFMGSSFIHVLTFALSEILRVFIDQLEIALFI
jgi:hypothetical protein